MPVTNRCGQRSVKLDYQLYKLELNGLLPWYHSMLGSLYGDLPQAKNAAQEEAATKVAKQNSWTPSSLAPPARKPAFLGAPPSVLRAGRGKPTSATQRQQAIKRENSDPAAPSTLAGAERVELLAQPCWCCVCSPVQRPCSQQQRHIDVQLRTSSQ